MEHTHHPYPRNDYGRFIATILFLCLLAAAGYALQHTISCFLLSWVIAYLLDPLLVSAERRGMKRLYALGLLYIILGILTVFFLAFIVPAITISASTCPVRQKATAAMPCASTAKSGGVSAV